MSAGNFDLDGKYESGVGNVYRCRPQPETSGLTIGGAANAYPAGAISPGLGTLTLSKGKRALGVIPRTVTVRFTEAPTGQVADYAGVGSRYTVPVFDPAVWDAISEGDTGTYLGVAVVVDVKSPELVR